VAAPTWTDIPIPDETADLREGPDLHPTLLPLLPLIGTWRGTGRGGYPTIEDFDYGQQVTFAHDGRGVLRYESRAWLLNEDGSVLRPGARETGWWRPGASPDELELLLAHPTGIVEIYVGRATGTTRWELSTDLVARIYQAIRESHECAGQLLTTDASIGIALAPQDGTDLDQLMKNADLALYAAKGGGRRTYRFFQPGMDARVKALRLLEQDLRRAIADGGFALCYQPLVSIPSNRITGCEALLRWRHPERGWISPARFPA